METLPYATPGKENETPAHPAAVRSLNWGLLFFLTPIPNVVAIVYGIVALRAIRRTPQRGAGLAVGGIVLGVCGLAGWIAAPIVVMDVRRAALRVNCFSDLRQVGAAIVTYAREHDGRFPEGWEDLITSGTLARQDARALVCPASDDGPARGATTQDVVAELGQPGHVSYVYCGQGLSLKTAKRTDIIAYEPLARHGGGMMVVYANGDVDYLDHSAAIAALRKVHRRQAATNRPGGGGG